MAFELPSLPSFQTNIPQQIASMPSPMEQYGKMLQLKALSGQIGQQQQMQPLQVQQAQQGVQAATLENKQRQMDIDSQQGIRDAVASGALTQYAGQDNGNGGGFDANGALRELLKNPKVQPAQAFQVVNSFLQRDQTMAEIAKTTAQGGEAQANIRSKGLDMLHDRVADVLAQSGDQQKAALGKLTMDLMPQNAQQFAGVPKMDLAIAFKAASTGNLDDLKLAAGGLDVDKKLADFHKATAEAATAQQPIINPQTGLSPAAIQEQKNKIAEETNPQVIAARAQQAAMTAQLVEPLRLQIQQQFGNQKDARDKIETTVLKPFQDKMSEIGELQAAIDQASQGNIAAARAALYKTIGVAQPAGTHRVAPTEVTGFSGMGSIPEQIRGSIANVLSGDPWTPQMVSDIKSFGQMQAQVAHDNLGRGIDNTNKLYGTNVGTALKAPQTQPAAAGPGKMLSMSALQQAAKDHGVSVDEAKRQAKAAGYTIQ